MAEEKPTKRILKKKVETVRERTERAALASTAPKARRLRSTAKSVSRPFKAAHRAGKKEYYLPLPDNKFGRFLNKRRSIVPRYFKEAWREVRKVEWPDRKLTIRLTIAVFVFSGVLVLIVSIVDFGLDKLFRKVFL